MGFTMWYVLYNHLVFLCLRPMEMFCFFNTTAYLTLKGASRISRYFNFFSVSLPYIQSNIIELRTPLIGCINCCLLRLPFLGQLLELYYKD